MKQKKIKLTFERFHALDYFIDEGILRVYTQHSDLATAFGVQTLFGDEIDKNLFNEVQKGNLVFPVRVIEGEVEILEEDTPTADIIGYLVMQAEGMEREGIDSRDAAHDWLQNYIFEDLELFLNGHTIECDISLNDGVTYIRGPFLSISKSMTEVAQEFRFDEIVLS